MISGATLEETYYDPPKVQIVLYLGFDEASEESLRVTWSVAQEILEEYGIWVEVIPIHVWVHDPIEIQFADLPKIEINGKTMIIGRIPSKEELVDLILSRVYSSDKAESEAYVIAALQRHDKIFQDVSIVSVSV